MMNKESLTEEEFEKKRKFKNERSKRNSYLGSAIFFFIVLIIFVYFLHGIMMTLQLIITASFISILILAFSYGAYTKQKILRKLN